MLFAEAIIELLDDEGQLRELSKKAVGCASNSSWASTSLPSNSRLLKKPKELKNHY